MSVSSAFVVGVAFGLRALIGLAAVSWAARSQHLALQGAWLAFLGFKATPFITSLLAVGELITNCQNPQPACASRVDGRTHWGGNRSFKWPTSCRSFVRDHR